MSHYLVCKIIRPGLCKLHKPIDTLLEIINIYMGGGGLVYYIFTNIFDIITGLEVKTF